MHYILYSHLYPYVQTELYLDKSVQMSVEYTFITITITLTRSGSICRGPYVGQIDLLKNYSYLIEPCAKDFIKTTKKKMKTRT